MYGYIQTEVSMNMILLARKCSPKKCVVSSVLCNHVSICARVRVCVCVCVVVWVCVCT